ncbi:MAG: hypothetical protein OHK0022_54060 [Roseiflexaceae bacterium]
MEPSAYSADQNLPPGSLPPGSLPPGSVPPPAPKSSNRQLVLILGSVTALTLAVCCVVLAVTSFGGVRLFQSVQRESQQTGALLEQFMQAAASQDAPAARALFLPQNEVSEEDLDNLFRERADAFRSYTAISQTSFNINSTNDETTATVSGKVSYAEERPGLRFEASLRKQGDRWYLVSIRFGQGFGI